MKVVEDIANRRVPIVTLDPTLDAVNTQALFPEKLAKANKMLQTATLPAHPGRKPTPAGS